MTIEKIFKELEKSNYETSTESRLFRTGLKDNLEITPILEKYKWLHELPTIHFVQESYEQEKDAEKKEELSRLFFALAGFYIYQKTSKLNDKVNTFLAQAEVEFRGKKITFNDIPPLIANSEDFSDREILQDKYFSVIEKANFDLLSILQSQITAIKEDLKFKDYVDFYQASKKINYFEFNRVVDNIYQELKSAYAEKMADWVEEVLKRPFGNLRSCHAAYLAQVKYFDQYFPKEKLTPVFKNFIRDLGLDAKNQQNINFDIEERPKKNPRAVCFLAKIPKEIHLVMKPIGGLNDFRTFFHEAGHSEYYAHVDENLPYAFRHLKLSPSLSEVYAYLFDSLTRNPLWLAKYLNLPELLARQISHKARLANLFGLIRYLAKFSYEYKFLLEEDFKSADKLYSEKLTSYTNFIYNPVMYLADMDSGFYSADYLRAWIGRAQFEKHLEKEFGEEWFADKKAGAWLKAIWRFGARYELEEMIIKEKAGNPFDFWPMVVSF